METTDTSPISSSPVDPADHDRYAVARERLAEAAKRIRASPIARGVGIWALLIGLAYVVGAFAIGPMIVEAAGLKPGVYSLSPDSGGSKSRAESMVQITPVSIRKPQPAVTAAPEPAKEKPRRKRKHRRRSLPPDEVYLGRSESGRGMEDGEASPEHRSRRHHRSESDSGSGDREEPQRSGNGESGLE